MATACRICTSATIFNRRTVFGSTEARAGFNSSLAWRSARAACHRCAWILPTLIAMAMMSRDHAERMCFLSVLSEQSVPAGMSTDRPQYEYNTLFLNRGDTTFAEIAQLSGLEAAEWAWSCVFLDVDLDGWEDLLVVDGIERTGRDLDVAAYLNQLRRGRPLSDAEV